MFYATRDRGGRDSFASAPGSTNEPSVARDLRSASASKRSPRDTPRPFRPTPSRAASAAQPPSADLAVAAPSADAPESPADALARKQELQFARARRAAARTGVPAPTAGEPPDARAEVILNGKTHDLEPGPSGTFPDLRCQALSTANVTVVYASGEGPPDVIVQAEDGGAFLDGSSVKAVHLDEANTARFTFISGVQYGHYRLSLRRGADIKTIPFWVETADLGRENQGTGKR